MSPETRRAIDTIWASHAALLQPALDQDGNLHTLASVKARVDDGRAQLWPGERSLIVTDLTEFPRGTVINFWLCGGVLDEALVLAERICAWAKAQGCISARLVGRMGWARVRHPGWRKIGVIMERSLA